MYATHLLDSGHQTWEMCVETSGCFRGRCEHVLQSDIHCSVFFLTEKYFNFMRSLKVIAELFIYSLFYIVV